MFAAAFHTLSLLDFSGHLIIAAILACLVGSVAANLLIRARYARIARDLRDHPDPQTPFVHPVLNSIQREARLAMLRTRELNSQAIIEQRFQAQLKPLLLGERFVRASTGLMIILGLVGTFYGLTLSIGKLVALVASETSGVTDITQAITSGLTQALTGMSVAFSTSLFGIVGAIIMMVFGIVSNTTDQRTAVMVAIENYIDHVLRTQPTSPGDAPASEAGARLEQALNGFSKSLETLDAAVGRFDASLQGFASSTREFKEFNLHLKDNVQRMSLSFADFSEGLKSQIGAARNTERT
jgi:hypothetical protein